MSLKEKFDKLNIGAMFVSDHQSYVYHLTPQQIKEVQNEYGEDHITLEKKDLSFYTFDLFYQNLKQRDEMIQAFKNELIINDHGGHGSCDVQQFILTKVMQLPIY